MAIKIKPEDLTEDEVKELWEKLKAGTRKAFESQKEYERVMKRIVKKRELFKTKNYDIPDLPGNKKRIPELPIVVSNRAPFDTFIPIHFNEPHTKPITLEEIKKLLMKDSLNGKYASVDEAIGAIQQEHFMNVHRIIWYWEDGYVRVKNVTLEMQPAERIEKIKAD